MALWSLATPLYAAPDEPVHVIKAAAVVRGELVGETAKAKEPAFALVTVPAFFGIAANRGHPACFHNRPTVPASCAPSLVGGTEPVHSWIYVARYPPLYYLLVGLPSLLGTGTWVLYLMRLASALVAAVLVGLGVLAGLRYSASRLVLVGGLVALTPMALFLGGVVNPNGLEVAAAFCVWTSGAVLVLEHLDDPPPGLLALFGGSACVLELVRSLSPLWLALTACTLVAVADLGRLRRFLARRSAKVVLGVVALAGVGALAWIIGEQATNVVSTGAVGALPESTILETSLARTDGYLQEMVGLFGWLDTTSPLLTYVVWYGLVGLVGLLAAAVGRLRQAVTLGLLALAVVVLPVAISSSQVHKVGFVWQGRDTLPLAIGLPILGAALLGASPLAAHGRRLARAVAPLVVLAQGAAFFEALRRYAVGTSGPDFAFLLHPSWRPPLGFAVLLSAEAVVLTLLVLLVSLAVRPLAHRGAVEERSAYPSWARSP